jgi:hypothetical protein
MTLQELKKYLRKWCTYYNNKGIPLKDVHVVITVHEPEQDNLVEVDDDNIQHGFYTARNVDEEIVGGDRDHEIKFISLYQFNDDNGMDQDGKFEPKEKIE